MLALGFAGENLPLKTCDNLQKTLYIKIFKRKETKEKLILYYIL